MKRTVPIIMASLVACVMLVVCMAPVSEATDLPDNPQGTTVDKVLSTDTMTNNYGHIRQTYGTITNNNGTIGGMENGTVGTNSGSIQWLDGGTVSTNSGVIEWMYGGTVVTNTGTIGVQQYGTVTENASDGTIETVKATQYQHGTVTTNKGMICDNYGEVGTNAGTIADNYGTVTNNTGTISRNWGTVTNNSGEIKKQYYPVTFVNNNSATVMYGVLNYDTLYLSTSSSAVLVPSAGYSFSSEPTATGCTLVKVDDRHYNITEVTGPVSITAVTESTSDALFWVGGTAVTGTASGEGWSYDANSNTLTLNNPDLNDFHYGAVKDINNEDQTYRAIIFDGRDTGLNIVLQNHSVLAESHLGLQYAIYVKGDLTISGTGSIHAATSMKSGAGIWSGGKLTIDGGSITADGCTVGLGSVGDVTFSGGEIYAMSERGGQCIFTPEGSVTISGGSVSANAQHGFDIWVAWNSFIMTGGTLSLDGSGCLDVNGAVTIEGGTIYSTGQSSYVIGVTGGSAPAVFTMTGGNVIVNGAEAGQQIVYASSFTLGNGITTVNTTPKTYDGEYNEINCELAEARLLYATADGMCSIGTGAAGFTVSFNSNGGTGTMAPVNNVLGQYVLPQNGFTGPDGKAFVCWSVNGVNKYPANVIVVGSDTVVTAVWEGGSAPVPAPTYTVSFDPNGGTGTMVAATGISGEYALPANGFTAPAEMTFRCWSVGGSELNPGAKITVNSDVSVKAVWKPIPAAEPEYSADDNKVYSNEVTAGMDTDVSGIFNAAKTNSGTVDVKVGTMEIAFDSAAVSAIGGSTVSLKAEVKTENLDVQDARAVIEVTLDGATFSNGKATVTVPFTEEVPSGKELVVYFINGDSREKMDATYENGKVVFTTNHFSEYAIVFEDESSPSGGFPIWIVAVGVVAVIAVGAVAFFLLRKH